MNQQCSMSQCKWSLPQQCHSRWATSESNTHSKSISNRNDDIVVNPIQTLTVITNSKPTWNTMTCIVQISKTWNGMNSCFPKTMECNIYILNASARAFLWMCISINSNQTNLILWWSKEAIRMSKVFICCWTYIIKGTCVED